MKFHNNFIKFLYEFHITFCLTIPFFLGPLQMIASSWLPSKNPIDISDKFSSINTGDQPEPDWWICSFKTPNILGCDGPQMSISSTAKFFSGFRSAMARASIDVTVLLPTPPFPDRINSLFFTSANRSFTSSMAGSGPFVAPDAHRFWLGQPAHADALPASSLRVPGQCSAAFSGMSDIVRNNLWFTIVKFLQLWNSPGSNVWQPQTKRYNNFSTNQKNVSIKLQNHSSK